MILDLKEKLQEAFRIDLSEAIRDLGIPVAAYERIVRISLGETGKRLLDIEDGFLRQDLESVQRAAHELTGVYLNLRLTPLADAARQMNMAARTGAADEARRAFEVLREQFTRLDRIFVE